MVVGALSLLATSCASVAVEPTTGHASSDRDLGATPSLPISSYIPVTASEKRLAEKTRQFIADYEAWNAAAVETTGTNPSMDIIDRDWAELLRRHCVPGRTAYGAVISSEPLFSNDHEVILDIQLGTDTGQVTTAHTNTIGYVRSYKYTFRATGDAWLLDDVAFRDDDGPHLSLLWMPEK
ncbi:MAG: hypothetical protein ACI9NG_002089 [Hyphomonas sp.]|jgi:hypothetical protein